MGYRGQRRPHGALLVVSPGGGGPGGLLAVTVLLVVVVVVSHPDRVAADLMGDIQQGLQTTGKLFGINTIADVADLVAKGFATRRGNPSEPTGTGEPDSGAGAAQGAGSAANTAGIGSGLSAQTPSMMMAMLKLLGLDGGQLGAMLVNSIIFLAHVIGSNLGAFRQPVNPLDPSQAGGASPPSSFLAREPPPAAYDRPVDGPSSRHPPPGTGESSATTPDANTSSSTTTSPASGFNPLEWVLRNPSKRFRVLLEQVQGTDLTEHLERELEHLNQYGPADTDCIRLLMCKIKPFIRKMQYVVRDQIVPPPTGGTTNQQRPQQQQQSTTTPGPPSGGEILDGIYHNLPTADEFLQQSERCDQQFRHCARELRKQ
ncbi:uncharacterized protein LOC125955684 [Anopheles darlingi]|uniref:uncharacterized protein LOC125955684 n=1 Tax=Anopheles darlingi TaxID=43151 RepID=UPI002100048F|nr:uncharacterized protein LOC125955684 [Anopheles darlingi]